MGRRIRYNVRTTRYAGSQPPHPDDRAVGIRPGAIDGVFASVVKDEYERLLRGVSNDANIHLDGDDYGNHLVVLRLADDYSVTQVVVEVVAA